MLYTVIKLTAVELDALARNLDPQSRAPIPPRVKGADKTYPRS